MSLAASLSRFRRRLPASRPRLLAASLAGAVFYLLLPSALGAPTRFVIAWNVGILALLGLLGAMMARATPRSIGFRARREDENAWVILAAVVGAALASMVAIFFVLREAKDAASGLAAVKMALGGLTILLSWLLCHSMYAIHYAHGFYDAPGAAEAAAASPDGAVGGLAFPGEDRPDYWDFLYFAFVVGMTCQVSDVQVTSRAMRRLTLVHGVVSFFFNTVILALTINIAAGLL